MRRIFEARFLTATLAFAGALTITAPAAAADRSNIVVMGEEADMDSVPRDSRVHRRIEEALKEQLYIRGFDVYDETAATLGTTVPGRKRRTDAELIDVVRGARRPPMDGVVLFTAYASAEELGYTTRIQARLTGRVLAVHSGQHLGSFEVAAADIRAPANCSRSCVLEAIGDQVSLLAQDLGVVLAAKLRAITPAPVAGTAPAGIPFGGFSLLFNGFDATERRGIEEYLVAFVGYRSHRPVRAGTTYIEYWYETAADGARLERNINLMLEHLGFRGRVAFSGTKVTVDRVGVRLPRDLPRD
jgi:hypothetical protein